jgi:hypothetical protein
MPAQHGESTCPSHLRQVLQQLREQAAELGRGGREGRQRTRLLRLRRAISLRSA